MSLPESKSEGASVAIEGALPDNSFSSRKLWGFEFLSSVGVPFARLKAWAVRGGASILQQGLHVYLNGVKQELYEVGNAFNQLYFAYS